MLLAYSVTVFKFAISHAIKVGILYTELHDISAKFTTKFNLINWILGSILTYALRFAVCYAVI